MNVVLLPKRSFRLRGRSFFTMVLTPELPLDLWLADLDQRLLQTPGFLSGKPLVLDIAGLDIPRSEFVLLIAALSERDIRILGVEGADAPWLGLGLPPSLTGGKPAPEIDLPGQAPASPAARARGGLVVDEPVRSGQTIVNPDGDVTVIGSIGSGAEVVAAGSIHVYGALRGRAFAGMHGDASARIFCRRLEAELLAIDGYYKLADELDPQLHRKPAQAWLNGQTLNILALD